jgi:hypothetical protein
MAVASIITSRIIKNWNSKYASLPVSSQLGEICSLTQPMYCLKDDLSGIFDMTSQDTHYDTQMLVNSASDKANDSNWNFDPETLVISNDSHCISERYRYTEHTSALLWRILETVYEESCNWYSGWDYPPV